MPLASIRKRYSSENKEFRKQHILVIFQQISLNRWIWKNKNIENEDPLAKVHKWIYEYMNIWNICRQSRRTTPNRQTDALEKSEHIHASVLPSEGLLSLIPFALYLGKLKNQQKSRKIIHFRTSDYLNIHKYCDYFVPINIEIQKIIWISYFWEL